MRLRSLSPVFALIFAAISASVPARAGLVITPFFDSTITNDVNHVAITNAINSAILQFETTYTSNITVPIYFQEGGGLGASEFYFYSHSYQDYYTHLVSTNANPAAIAGLTANGGNSVNNPVTGNSTIMLKSADARAVGISTQPGCLPNGAPGSMTCTFSPGTTGVVDGIITLNTSLTYPSATNDGSHYSLISVAEHEID